MANKGKKLRFCTACGCKRFCSKAPGIKDYWKIECSRGHSWQEMMGTIDQINKILLEHWMPKLAENMFQESPLLAYLNKHR